MKEALFYSREGQAVKCLLCPWECTVQKNKLGVCGVRKNVNGRLMSLVFGKPCAVSMDPIEKKPLYHFHPAEPTLSIATAGCNLMCSFCQNWSIAREFDLERFQEEYSPERVVKMCKDRGSRILSFTYTEPTVFYEYMLETAKLARKAGLKCVMVSNGYINEEPLRKLCKHLDAANIDLKGDAEFYRKVCKGDMEHVLKSLKVLKEEGVWLEVTNLIVPGYNDDKPAGLAKWISENLGRDVPLHLSRFFPDYRMKDVPPTPIDTMKKALKACEKHLDFVYLGNVGGEVKTLCPHCRNEVVDRGSFGRTEIWIDKGKCAKCRKPVAGVWE